MKHIQSKNSQSTLTNVRPEDVQPNAVDLRLGRVFKMKGYSIFELSDDIKSVRETEEIQPAPLHWLKHIDPINETNDNWFFLPPGTYEIVMDNIIKIGPNEAGWAVTRSTLVRNGIFIVSGLYDSGYSGAMGAALHVTQAPFVVRKGTRIGQFLLFDAEALSKYDGSYGFNEDGSPKPLEQKYHS